MFPSLCFLPAPSWWRFFFLFDVSKMTKSWCETDSKALDRKEYYQERRLKDLQLDLPWEVRYSRALERRSRRLYNVLGTSSRGGAA